MDKIFSHLFDNYPNIIITINGVRENGEITELLKIPIRRKIYLPPEIVYKILSYLPHSKTYYFDKYISEKVLSLYHNPFEIGKIYYDFENCLFCEEVTFYKIIKVTNKTIYFERLHKNYILHDDWKEFSIVEPFINEPDKHHDFKTILISKNKLHFEKTCLFKNGFFFSVKKRHRIFKSNLCEYDDNENLKEQCFGCSSDF